MNYEPTSDDIAITFAKRQTPDSEFSHWEISDEALVCRVVANFHDWKQGYREGVILVPVAPHGFFSGVVTLNSATPLEARYEARREGEEPRKKIVAVGSRKDPAKHVDVVLYNHAVLAENDEASTDCEWEIISVNASPTEGEMPIMPDALIANHFELSGGTATNMTDEEFVKQLRESVLFWKNKCLVSPKLSRT